MATFHVDIYESHLGDTVELGVPEPPMGCASGYIPPPVISFFHNGAQIEFAYTGRTRHEARGHFVGDNR